jgi:hypothetical protein
VRLLRWLLRWDDVVTFGVGALLLWRGLHMVAESLPYIVIGALLVWLALAERLRPRKET